VKTSCRMCEADNDYDPHEDPRIPCPVCGACFLCAQDDCGQCLRRREFLREEQSLVEEPA
jgi:hypothetical protein